jgi:hypothetical protein
VGNRLTVLQIFVPKAVFCSSLRFNVKRFRFYNMKLAQLTKTTNLGVRGSNPFGRSILFKHLAAIPKLRNVRGTPSAHATMARRATARTDAWASLDAVSFTPASGTPTASQRRISSNCQTSGSGGRETTRRAKGLRESSEYTTL